MNGYEKAESLGLTGTDAEIVATLKAKGLTARKVNLGELTLLLRNRSMLTKLTYEDPQTGMKWNGSVAMMIVGMAAGKHPALPAVNKWFSHITDPRSESFDTTDPAIAAEFWGLAQAVGSGPGMPSAADFAAVAALGGGWMFADLTVDQFAEQRAATETEQARQSIRSRLDAIWNKIGTSEQSDGITDLRAIADELEAA